MTDVRLHVPAPPVALFEPRIVPVIAPPPVTERRYSLEPLQDQLRELDSIRGDRSVSVAEEAHVQGLRGHVLRQITELKQQR